MYMMLCMPCCRRQASAGFITLVHALGAEWETGELERSPFPLKYQEPLMAWVHLYKETHIFELQFVNQLTDLTRMLMRCDPFIFEVFLFHKLVESNLVIVAGLIPKTDKYGTQLHYPRVLFTNCTSSFVLECSFLRISWSVFMRASPLRVPEVMRDGWQLLMSFSWLKLLSLSQEVTRRVRTNWTGIRKNCTITSTKCILTSFFGHQACCNCPIVYQHLVLCWKQGNVGKIILAKVHHNT